MTLVISNLLIFMSIAGPPDTSMTAGSGNFTYQYGNGITGNFPMGRALCLDRRANLPLISPDIAGNVAWIKTTISATRGTSWQTFVDVHPYGNYSNRMFITGAGL
jgi:hypothetical protein